MLGDGSVADDSHPHPGALRPVDLRVERQSQPLGVGERHPLFSWRLTGDGRGHAQTAYHIRVTATADANVVWDTGEVTATRSYDLPYAGDGLASRASYEWAVRVRDEAGLWSDWSDATRFETALQEDDWTAAWITSQDEAHGSSQPQLDPAHFGLRIERIWLPDVQLGREVSFRTSLNLAEDDPAEHAAATLAGPGLRELMIGDVAIPVSESGTADPAALLAAIRPGSNEVRIRATATNTDPHGLLAHVEVRLRSRNTVRVVTDGTWMCSDDGTTWRLAEAIGKHGDPPRGKELASLRPSPYLRREFEITQPVRRARIYATALGVYELRLNGQRIGRHRLSPGWTDYRVRVPVQTFDVTDLLSEGSNALGAVLADGWYAGQVAMFGAGRYGTNRALRLQLEIELADGTVAVTGSDDSWTTSTGSTRYADLQNGEVVDARLEPVGWDQPGFGDGEWSAAIPVAPEYGRLEAEVAPPVVVTEDVPAVDVIKSAVGTQIVDFGQNLVGWVRLKLRGESGQRVFVRHAEMLDQTDPRGPSLYTEALRGASCTDEFVLAGDPNGETFEPRFTFRGFRYAEIIGAPGPVAATDATALVATADMEPTGTFECSDPRLNRLQQNIVWSQRGNFLTVPTDCPQRDERMGWTGDAQVFAATASFNYDVRGFMRKWLRDLRDGQLANGSVPHVAPDMFTLSGWDVEGSAGAAGWGDAIVIVPHELARIYGDERSIEENLDAIGAWLDYCEATCDSDGLRPDFGFGDWLAITATPKDLVATAFLARAADLAADLADRVGASERAATWRTLHDKTRQAFRNRWVRGGGVIRPGTQTAYVLALHFGLFDDVERDRAADRLVAEIRSRHWHLTTGFLGTPYLLDVLSVHGHDDVAFRLLTQESYPSWLYQVVHGDATTIWERWDSWSDSRGFQDPGMTSFNHYAYGAVGDWIYRTLGGIAIGPDGPSQVVVRPRPGGGVTSARASLRTVLGPVETEWQLDGDAFRLGLTVPVGAQACVQLPDGTMTDVGSGRHTFSCSMKYRPAL